MNNKIAQELNELHDKLNTQITTIAGLGKYMESTPTRHFLFPAVSRLEDCLSTLDEITESIEQSDCDTELDEVIEITEEANSEKK